eukprot:9469617-Pyramimonas_sp.AAC.1
MTTTKTTTMRAHVHVEPSQAVLGYLNWLAPCHIKAITMRAQEALLGTMATDTPQSISLVLLPIFAHAKGTLWQEGQQRVKALANQTLNVDAEIAVLCSGRKDSREGRPATMPGRLCYQLGGKDPTHHGHWVDSLLLDQRRTEPGAQMATKDMVSLEDYDPNAMPQDDTGSDSKHGSVRGAKRYEQIGEEICTKILESTLDGLPTTGQVAATLFVDAHVSTGDTLKARVAKAASMSVPSYFFGLAHDSSEAEWVRDHVIESIALDIKAGTKNIAGIKMPTVAEEADPAPMTPQLKVLVWDAENKVVRVPTEQMARAKLLFSLYLYECMHQGQ